MSRPIPSNAIQSPSGNETYVCRVAIGQYSDLYLPGHASRWNGSWHCAAIWEGESTSYGKTGQFHVLSLPVGCAPLIWHRPNVSDDPFRPDGAITAGCAIGGSAPISPPITQCPESCGYCTYPCFSEKAKVLGDYHYDPDDPACFYSVGGVIGSSIHDFSLLYPPRVPQ